MSMPGSPEAEYGGLSGERGAIHVLSTAEAWLVLLPGVTSPVQCSSCADTLQGCELCQDLPNLLVPVLTEAPSLRGCRPACKENPNPCPNRGVAGCATRLMPFALAASPRVN